MSEATLGQMENQIAELKKENVELRELLRRWIEEDPLTESEYDALMWKTQKMLGTT